MLGSSYVVRFLVLVRLARFVWFDWFGSARLVRFAWLDYCICVLTLVSFAWFESCGSNIRFVWLDSVGPNRLVRLLDVFGSIGLVRLFDSFGSIPPVNWFGWTHRCILARFALVRSFTIVWLDSVGSIRSV